MNRIIITAFLIGLSACTDSFLSVKPDSALAIPAVLKDLQALLDNSSMMNARNPSELGEIGADNYMIAFNQWELLTNPYQKNGHIWAKDVYEGIPVNDWVYAYSKILYCNTVLAGLKKIPRNAGNALAYDNIEGSALFFRAYTYYQLSQLFSKPYDQLTANNDLGVPLRLEAELESAVYRPKLSVVYLKIIEDLQMASEKLPQNPLAPQRPSNTAAFYLLSRVYLHIGEYEKSLQYAEKVLNAYPTLTDFAKIDPNLRYPFPVDVRVNKEVIFHTWMQSNVIFSSSRLQIPPDLVELYDENDYRKRIFFFLNNGLLTFKGSYQGSSVFFTGFTTPEMYITKAECLYRLGKEKEAALVLDHFLSFRIKNYRNTGLWGQTLLDKILEERRKELVFRGVRWEDLRRLNKEVAFQKRITRNLNGLLYELKPMDKRYVWPIPDDVIAISEIEQNER
ncbi:RagB/SusD family nutrient uptake outer membrane protein [Emticicia sp. TH156]|uniref:RagB/SusD family nutrient uptake outer membrane protein n=1 Tax=Emticicia sp. TH156 TaxID=2067454 RepID=UPI000C784B8C|nr:RagB/SusD family nutrient uptake outer membrane protein [Emticicia sp. TH156]PLK44965.1 hypothetical protein C0V77_06885 [Emticicia sp. TH156]